MIQPIPLSPKKYRTIWISDLHLGAKSSRPDCVLDFIRHNEADTIYLVGDIIDGWRLKKTWFWDQKHNDVVQKLLRASRKGAKVFYIPGNHDQFARDHIGLKLGDIEVCRQCHHITADGRHLLVMHGDEFDGIVTHAKWLAMLGSGAYEVSVFLNHWLNVIRERMGMSYWSFSAYLKQRVKKACMFVDNFEQAVVHEAQRQEMDGIVCGHIHRAAIKEFDGITYYNTGDWVESCTALVEHFDGKMELVEWVIPRYVGQAKAKKRSAKIKPVTDRTLQPA